MQLSYWLFSLRSNSTVRVGVYYPGNSWPIRRSGIFRIIVIGRITHSRFNLSSTLGRVAIVMVAAKDSDRRGGNYRIFILRSPSASQTRPARTRDMIAPYKGEVYGREELEAKKRNDCSLSGLTIPSTDGGRCQTFRCIVRPE